MIIYQLNDSHFFQISVTIGELFKDPNNNNRKNSIYDAVRGDNLTWGRGLNPVVVEICLKKNLRDKKRKRIKKDFSET